MVEANENVRVFYFTGDELAVVETLAVVECQFNVADKNGVLKFIGFFTEFFAYLLHQRDEEVVLFVCHVQGFVHTIVKKGVVSDVFFEGKTVQQVGMEQECPTGNRHPFAVIFLAAHLSGCHAQ